MVKSVLGVSHQGTRDWVVQRSSAILMAIYTIGLMAYIMLSTDLSFAEWHTLFAYTWMKVATILFIFALICHAWVGIWTVFTDYIHWYVLRSILNSLVLLLLAACLVWALLILWSV